MGTQSMVALPSVAQTAPRRGKPAVLELFEKVQPSNALPKEALTWHPPALDKALRNCRDMQDKWG